MKVYIVLESFDNGETWMDEDDGYVGWDDKYKACFRDVCSAWTYLCMLIEHERQWFKEIYNAQPDHYRKPRTTFAESDSEHSAEIYLKSGCGKKMQYSVRIVEEDI